MEYPHLQQLHAKRGSDFALVSVEVSNRPEMAKKYVAEVGATFTVLLDEQKEARKLFELKGVPTTLVIDRDGKIIFRHLGFTPGHERMFEAEIQYLLEQGEGAGERAQLGELIR